MPGLKRHFRSKKKSSRPTKRSRVAGVAKRSMTMKRKKRLFRTSRAKRTKRSAASSLVVRTNLQTLVYDNNDQILVLNTTTGTQGSVDTKGKQCVYGWVGCTSEGTAHQVGLLGLKHIRQMADILVRAQSLSLPSSFTNETKISIIDCYQTSELVNASNSIANIQSYLVRCRRDVAAVAASGYINLYNLIGQGFYQRNFGTSAFNLNEGLTDSELTLYDSHKFCSEFHIVKTRSTKLDPGATSKFTVRQSNKVVNWNHYSTQSAQTTTPIGTVLDYCHREGEMFWIHRAEGTPASDGSGNTTYSHPNIRMITKSHYNFVQVNPTPPVITKIAAQGYKQLGSLNTQVINDDTGAPNIEQYA